MLFNPLDLELSIFAVCPIHQCWNRVFGSRVTRSTILAWSGRVGSWVSLTDPVSEPVYVAFACALLMLLGREYATLESLGFCILCIFMSSCLLAQIPVICYFLVVYYSATVRKFYLLTCSIYSRLFVWHSVTGSGHRVTGLKASGLGPITGQRFRPGSIPVTHFLSLPAPMKVVDRSIRR